MTLQDLQVELEENYNVLDEDWPNWINIETEVVYSNGECIIIHIMPNGDEYVKLLVVTQGDFDYTGDTEIDCEYEEIHDAIYEIKESFSK